MGLHAFTGTLKTLEKSFPLFFLGIEKLLHFGFERVEKPQKKKVKKRWVLKRDVRRATAFTEVGSGIWVF